MKRKLEYYECDMCEKPILEFSKTEYIRRISDKQLSSWEYTDYVDYSFHIDSYKETNIVDIKLYNHHIDKYYEVKEKHLCDKCYKKLNNLISKIEFTEETDIGEQVKENINNQ